MSFTLLGASDRMRRYRTAYFANICIRIIRAFFHMKQKKLCHISDKAASLQPQKQKYLQFICDKFLTSRPLTEEPGN